MAKPTKKTLEDVAAENRINISEENAQKVADNYIQPTIDAINKAEQQAITDTQAARKALENEYFKQYRNSMYNAQSRGLTGGLANMEAAQLNMQLGQANADLSKNLLAAQAQAKTSRGTALTTAESYKTDYLNKMLDKVSALREQDYAQRYAEWQYAEQMAQAQKEFEENKRRWQLDYQLSLDRYATEKAQWEKNYLMSQAQLEMQKDQFEYEKSLRDTNKKQQDLQYAANVKEYLNMELPDVANTYMAYMNSGDTSKAADYLGRTAAQLSNKYGVNANSVINDVHTVYNYNRASSTATNPDIEAGMSQSNTKSFLYGGIGSLGAGLSIGLAPFTGGLSLIGLAPSIGSLANYEYTSNEYERYKKVLDDAAAERDRLAPTLPSWYAGNVGQ